MKNLRSKQPCTSMDFCIEFGKTQVVMSMWVSLKACKLYYDKYMIGSTQITNTKNFAFIAVQAIEP